MEDDKLAKELLKPLLAYFHDILQDPKTTAVIQKELLKDPKMSAISRLDRKNDDKVMVDSIMEIIRAVSGIYSEKLIRQLKSYQASSESLQYSSPSGSGMPPVSVTYYPISGEQYIELSFEETRFIKADCYLSSPASAMKHQT